MYPELPVATKVRLFPYLLLVAVGLMFLGDLERPGTATAEPKRAGAAAPSRAARADIPRRYLALYRSSGGREVWRTAGGGRYATWAVLAAVGKVESDHGRARGSRPGGSSSAGALGPMQFMPGTWPGYGHGSVYNPANAIPAAKRYLRAHRAKRDLGWALAAYNAGPGRADHPPAVTRRYVANVRALARRYQKGTP
jgi:soluble lytic murein transglycosylase-like protein